MECRREAENGNGRLASGQRWDGAFLMGFLHHVKESAPVIVSRLSKVVPRVVVVDPNGDNLIRKTLE